jgi:transposase InsO family protein
LETVALREHQQVTVSPATVSRYLSRLGLVTPDPAKRPRSSYIRYAAEMPNKCWQSDFTDYPLAGGQDAQVLTWLDEHSRYALSVTAHAQVTGPAVLEAFRAACRQHGIPASPPAPKPLPGTPAAQPEQRVRTGRADADGKISLDLNGKRHSIGTGREYARIRVLILVNGLHMRIINRDTGELIRELTIDPARNYQPTGKPRGRRKHSAP